MVFKSARLNASLSKAHPAFFNVYCMGAAFLTYFCMYSFRKPFSVGTFSGESPLFGVEYKIILIVAQVIGYTLSKFLGVKVVSETSGSNRAFELILLIGIAEAALLLFAITPAPYNFVFMFINGLPLGMIWGLVFGFLEGRKTTELLGAGLSASYIIASGMVKTVGKLYLKAGISEQWMPFLVGASFFPVFLLAVYLLNSIPSPTAEDIELRTERKPMFADDRSRFFKTFYPGLIALTGLYMLLTAYRDFRDNFTQEIWTAVGLGDRADLFATTEIPVAFGVLVALATLFLIKSNKRALLVIHLIMLSGTLLVGLSTLAFQIHMISPVTWMILIGLGLYLAYVPYGCMLFDRLIAATHFIGTAGFMIYITDAFGYLGSVFLMFYKNFAEPNVSWLSFFSWYSYLTSIVCSACFAYSMFYFYRQGQKRKALPTR